MVIDTSAVAAVPFQEPDQRCYDEVIAAAFRRSGKGRHPAGLKIGDCFSYALAVATEQPLLFKGSDFAMTDIRPAVPTAGRAL